MEGIDAKKYVIFGAGTYGKQALDELGSEMVRCFVDNDSKKCGNIIYGKRIISFKELKQIYKTCEVIIAMDLSKSEIIIKQLEDSGINNYQVFLKMAKETCSFSKRHENLVDINKTYLKGVKWIYDHSINKQGISVDSKGILSSSKVSGCFISTLINWGHRELAETYAAWLCNVQHSNGSWYDMDQEVHCIVTSAQVIKGLLAISKYNNMVDKHIIRGCDYLISNIQEAYSKIEYLCCLSPLMEAAEKFSCKKYREIAEKVLRYYKSNRENRIISFNTLSCVYADAIESLIDIGEKDLVQQFMEKVGSMQLESGMIPASNTSDWTCATWLFQLALVWYKMEDYERGNKTFNFACSLQNKSGGWYNIHFEDDKYITVEEKLAIEYKNVETSCTIKYFLDALQYKCKLEFESQAYLFPDNIEKKDGRYEAVLKEIKAYPAGEIRICDVGCGKGRYLKNLQEDLNGNKLYAVDISKRVMEGIDVTYEKEEGMLTHIPYKDGKFDFVYSVEALEHAIDTTSAIREMLRVTKNNGQVMIIDKNVKAMGRLPICTWEKWFDNSQMQKLAEQFGCGFRIIEDISYENNQKDGLFNAWIFYKN